MVTCELLKFLDGNKVRKWECYVSAWCVLVNVSYVDGVRLMAAFFHFHGLCKWWNLCPFFHQMLFLSLSMLHMCYGFACASVCVRHHAIDMRSTPNEQHSPQTNISVCWFASRQFFAPTKLSIEYPFRALSIERALHSTALYYECMNCSPLLTGIVRTIWYNVHVFQCYMNWLYWSKWISEKKKLIWNTEQWINLQWIEWNEKSYTKIMSTDFQDT